MDQKLIDLLKKGKIGVIPTDTIYGIVGSALNPETVEKIYQLRKRALDKPMIILISGVDDLDRFGIKLSDKQKEFLETNWPNQLSVVLPISSERFKYLHRGTNSLAFRVPNNEQLLELLKKVGPLVAPSANIEGKKPSQDLHEARKYFGELVNFYVDRGYIPIKVSTLIKLKVDGNFELLRQGSFNPKRNT